MNYLNIIKIAILIFPIICIILSLPFLIYHYRKYGSISFLRFLLIFSFIFYLLCSYFQVILPLPYRSAVANYKTAYYNLKPFFIVNDVFLSGKFNITNPDTYIFLLNEKYFEPILNIILTIPFGIYLRYYFKCSFTKTFFLSFLLSLFFELTQLSGLYFIYPRPYRLFDVNDLINNTSGGIIGYIICPLFSFFLPSRDKIDNNDYINGNNVSILRNGLSVLIDYFIIYTLIFILYYFNNTYTKIIYILLTFITFVILPYISSGYTFGKWILKFKNQGNDIDGSIKITKYIIKWLLLHIIILNGWIIIMIFNNRIATIPNDIYLIYLIGLFIFIIYCFICLILEKDIFINKILKISNISTIFLEDEKKSI